ncbi:MAG: hypothetical protein JW779_00625 [Candidatus Thorarchaeota archaeon]|nr:hypothetical protein [Candidatus Thorarchaeota archaeon]
MEYINFLIVGIGCLVLFEGARRLDLVDTAGQFSARILNKNEEGIPDNCVSYKILVSPSEGAKWSPGIGAAIGNRPFALFLLISLSLSIFGALVTYVVSYANVGFFVVAFVFSLALHSGPDKISNSERYLQIIVAQDPSRMNGHDLKFLTRNIKEYRSWPRAQAIFGLIFTTSII